MLRDQIYLLAHQRGWQCPFAEHVLKSFHTRCLNLGLHGVICPCVILGNSWMDEHDQQVQAAHLPGPRSVGLCCPRDTGRDLPFTWVPQTFVDHLLCASCQPQSWLWHRNKRIRNWQPNPFAWKLAFLSLFVCLFIQQTSVGCLQ